jgi:hypothetical protein
MVSAAVVVGRYARKVPELKLRAIQAKLLRS